MTPIPRLVTERLLLRPMSANDWRPYCALMLSDRARFMGGPFSMTAAWGMFCADHAQWDWFGAGALMLEERSTGACLGQVGINSGPLFPEHEIGWLVFAKAEGHGFAFEAASALLDWAKNVKRLNALVSYVDPQNERSRKLAERLGGTQDQHAKRPNPTDLVYRHLG